MGQIKYKYNAGEIIRKYISMQGIPLSYIAKNTSIKYELLRRSIFEQSRKLRADEFLEVLDCLGIKIEYSKEQEILQLL